jgi:Protein of unknown function (DUF3995)
MKILALIVFATLTAIAALHAAWGLKIRWPAVSERKLVATVVGRKGLTKMPPPWSCFVVAAAIFLQGVIALLAAGWLAAPLSKPIVSVLALLCALVFVGRGIMGFTPDWRARFPQKPFAALDREYFSPLCLALGVAFVLLSLHRLGWL